MKNKTAPTDHEKLMREDDFIVSKTDLKGRITYGNRIFIEFSGYSERELLGTQHNIIRHPDMPRGAFKLLWDTIQQDREFFGYVKNMAKDGSYYWVFTNVTADRDKDGKLTGYFSVRRKPRASGVKTISEIYRAMLAEEQRAGPRGAIAASVALLNRTLSTKGASYEQFVLEI